MQYIGDLGLSKTPRLGLIKREKKKNLIVRKCAALVRGVPVQRVILYLYFVPVYSKTYLNLNVFVTF